MLHNIPTEAYKMILLVITDNTRQWYPFIEDDASREVITDTSDG